MAKYCKNCQQSVSPTGRINWIIAIILLFLAIIPGIIYIFYCLVFKSKSCPQCGDANFGSPQEASASVE